MASVKILTHLAFQRNVQPVLDAIQPYVVVLMHHSSMMYGLPVTCRKASSPPAETHEIQTGYDSQQVLAHKSGYFSPGRIHLPQYAIKRLAAYLREHASRKKIDKAHLMNTGLFLLTQSC